MESQPSRDGTDSLHRALEDLCRRGCRYVTQVIARMEQGEVPPELGQLDAAARRAVLAELKAIMAVYDAPCDLRAPPEGQSPRA